MADNSNQGWRRMINASVYSWQGLRATYRHEAAFRQEIWVCVLLLPLGIYLGQSGLEKAILVASLLLVPLVEVLNSAVEAVVDRIGTTEHELAGRAKDMGSAAVALAILIAAIVWVLVLFVE